MWSERLKEVAAFAMIGEGAVGLVDPRRHLRLWNFGPSPYRRVMDKMEEHPGAMRAMFAAELGLGMWWAMKQVCRAGNGHRLEQRRTESMSGIENRQPANVGGLGL